MALPAFPALLLPREWEDEALERSLTTAGFTNARPELAPHQYEFSRDGATVTVIDQRYGHYPSLVSFRGKGREQARVDVARVLPVLGVDDVRRKLRDTNPFEIVGGLHAAQQAWLFELVDEIGELRWSADEQVSVAATAIHGELWSALRRGVTRPPP